MFYVLLTVHLGIILVYNQLDPLFFFMYVYLYSLHVSGSHVSIMRINGINCLIQTCTLNGHLFTVIYTRCRIDTINSPDDENMAAQNM
jgi:hypothetical protein